MLLFAMCLPETSADISDMAASIVAELSADDECGAIGGAGAECALNALQSSALRKGAGEPKRPRVEHFGRNCWRDCQGAGMCEHFCGLGNACCRRGLSTDPPECKGVKRFPVWHIHTCVQSPWSEAVKKLPEVYKDPSLFKPSNASVLDFYMYRVQSDEDYDPDNQNLGNIGGVLWYLHNEIVWHPGLQRSGTAFSTPKTRIERFRVKVKATQPLWNLGMNFGVVNTFDWGQCSGPYGCHNFAKFGFTVGCETWAKGSMADFPHTQWDKKNKYPNATWYSFPGVCPSQGLDLKTAECERREPGGRCATSGEPTGTGNCTYTYLKVGEISINDLEGIGDPDKFMQMGGEEYNRKTDSGNRLHFWDDINNSSANQWRIDHTQALFSKKYPDQPALPDPGCDFKKRVFFPGHFGRLRR